MHASERGNDTFQFGSVGENERVKKDSVLLKSKEERNIKAISNKKKDNRTYEGGGNGVSVSERQ